MTPPVFVIAGSDLLVFESMDVAANYMEAIDVRDGEHQGAFDADGRRLEIVAESDCSSARIFEPPDAADGSGRLEDAVRQDLRRLIGIGPDVLAAIHVELDGWRLPQLVEARLAIERSWEERRRRAWWRRVGRWLRRNGSHST